MANYIHIEETTTGFIIKSNPRSYTLLKILGPLWILLWFSAICIGIYQLLNGNLPTSRFHSVSTVGFITLISVATLVGILVANYLVHQVFGKEILQLKDGKLVSTRTKRFPSKRWVLPSARVYSIKINKDYYSSRLKHKGEYLLNPEGGLIIRVGKKNYFHGTGISEEEANRLLTHLNKNIFKAN